VADGKAGQRLDLTGADLSGANLSEDDLNGAILRRTKLIGVDLSRAFLYAADLTSADLRAANLTGADVAYARLNGCLLGGASLDGINYEPTENPTAVEIAHAEDLDKLRWGYSSDALMSLRKSLQDAGYTQQARLVNTSLHRSQQNWLEKLVFDDTCEWGANWLRPLQLMGILSLLCSFIYWIGLRFGTKGGLFLLASGERIETGHAASRTRRITAGPNRNQSLLPFQSNQRSLKTLCRMLLSKLRAESKALNTAVMFSLMSTFNIGFQGLDFARAMRSLQTRDFDLKARGWLRTVSGLQSLLGVALVALSLLSYFGHAFD
jgi:hypothetical protein